MLTNYYILSTFPPHLCTVSKLSNGCPEWLGWFFFFSIRNWLGICCSCIGWRLSTSFRCFVCCPSREGLIFILVWGCSCTGIRFWGIIRGSCWPICIFMRLICWLLAFFGSFTRVSALWMLSCSLRPYCYLDLCSFLPTFGECLFILSSLSMKSIPFNCLFLFIWPFWILHLLKGTQLCIKASTQLISYGNFMVYSQVTQIFWGFHGMNPQVWILMILCLSSGLKDFGRHSWWSPFQYLRVIRPCSWFRLFC